MFGASRCLLYFGAVLLIRRGYAANDNPNMIFIMADDMGWNDIGYHGSFIRTPNLDRLAGAGIRLESHYVQPLCTPTRSELLSGRYNIHTGMQHGVQPTTGKGGMPLEVRTFAQEIQALGYNTQMIGKWHLGFSKDAYTPWHRGFDEFYGILTGHGDHYTHEQCYGSKSEEICATDFRINDQILINETNNYSTDLYADRAIRVIEQHTGSGGLFIFLSFQAPHSPQQAPQDVVDSYQGLTTRPTYAAMVTCLDSAVGRVEAALNSNGMMDNSIIIFASDNGGTSGHGNYPLRGAKNTFWEGGIRTLSFVNSPLIPRRMRGTTNNNLIHVTDWFPTIVSIAGGTINDSLSLDGFNQWSAIKGRAAAPRNEILHNIDELKKTGTQLDPQSFDNRMRAAYRLGDMKLVTGNQNNGPWYFANGSVSHSLTEGSDKNLWLFNMTTDPNEEHDLSGEADMQPTLMDMLNRLALYDAARVPALNPEGDPNFYLPNGVFAPWDNDNAVLN